jgi:hypothetical protein
MTAARTAERKTKKVKVPFLPAQQPGGQISATFDGVASIVKRSQFNQL